MARIASSASCAPSSLISARLAAGSSTIASTTKLTSASSALSQVTRTLPLTLTPAFSHSALHPAVGLLRRAVGARQYHHVAALGGHGREAARDGSTSGDSDSFGHCWLPVG